MLLGWNAWNNAMAKARRLMSREWKIGEKKHPSDALWPPFRSMTAWDGLFVLDISLRCQESEGEAHTERNVGVEVVEGNTLLAQLANEAVCTNEEVEVGGMEVKHGTTGDA